MRRSNPSSRISRAICLPNGSISRWAATPPEISSFAATRCGVGRRLYLLDQLHLRAVGSLEETDVAAVVGRHFFENAHAVGLQLGQSPQIIVGLDGDVLDTVMLLGVLAGDQCCDVARQPV